MFQKTGDSLLGFTATRIRRSEELGARIVELVYDKTGTPVCWIDNGLENKLFSVAFKTLPEDSTGVFHILEHSVLCGSAKYPVREPFVELLKSSMNTFLNAMTFPDKTMYPISSRNRRDFLNLTEVYLDAVFAPRMLEDPNIFYQEGWHIEQDDDGTLRYKGVVFNEMKGAMSGPDHIGDQKLIEMLFPDNCYGYNSGGDPQVIPSLPYRQFCETYRRFYHPSNARIFLDGDIPLEETLSLIASYLVKFDRRTDLPEIAEQAPAAHRETVQYELAKDESIENKAYLLTGKLIGSWRDRVRILAVRVLNDVLAGSNDAPLKRAVLSAGLAQEMVIAVEDSVAQPYLEFELHNIADGKADALLELIRSTARSIAAEGLDREALEASANRLEFRMQEPEEPQGLDRCISAMNSWLHGGDPLMYLLCREDFVRVREMIAAGDFEKLLLDLYANEENTAVLLVEPSYTYGEELRQDEEQRLAAIAAGWSEQNRAENAALNQSLLNWQQTPDTPEQLATLPSLPLTEVSPEPEHFETAVRTEDGVTVLYHPGACRDIVHVSLYFALTDRSTEELAALSSIGSFLGKLSTKSHSALKLQQILKNTVGRMSFDIELNAKEGVTETCTPIFVVRYSVLRSKLDEAGALAMEILTQTDFSERDKLREIVMQLDERSKRTVVAAGHSLGVISTLSHYSAAGAVADALGGYTNLRSLRALAADFDSKYDDYAALMKDMLAKTVCRARLTASVTAAHDCALHALLSALPEGTPVPADARYTAALPDQMGYVIPAQIGFAVQGWQLSQKGMQYDGSLSVAAKILSLSYLWNQVRVQGGAYGTGLSIAPSGAVYTYSYRDPSPMQSLAVNSGFSDFIRSFCDSAEPIEGYIISTVADDEPLRSPRVTGITADMLWFSGRTEEARRTMRRQMLSATKETLRAHCDIWDAFAANGDVCVVAAESVLADAKELTVCE